MQKLKILISVLLFSFPFLLNAQIQKVEFQASGLTCSMCSNAINKALKNLPFIESINVDLNRNLFAISFSKKATADIDAIKKKVEDAGFSIAKFWIYIAGDNQQVTNDEHVVLGGREFHFMHVSPQTLNGLQRLQVIDKNFVSAKEFKKWSALTSMPCYQTGMMGNCCRSREGVAISSGRIYHVTI
jgi:copper chaperone CopZ